MRRVHTAILAALTTTDTSGAVDGNVTGNEPLKSQVYGRATFGVLRRRRILLEPRGPYGPAGAGNAHGNGVE